ncbi:unnamed protein product [Peniophora sp. CBMAI 1063]|nr:unnamed protein product [Peniophora sp. CBMAI 1063]
MMGQQPSGNVTSVIRAAEQSVAAGSSLPSANDSVLVAQRKEKEARFAQSCDAGITEIISHWWSYSPVTVADNERIELSFVEATGNSEHWETELVPCSLSEPFTHVAQRFHVDVASSKRYRHPFLPYRPFDLLLKSDQRSDFDSLSSRTIIDVLGYKARFGEVALEALPALGADAPFAIMVRNARVVVQACASAGVLCQEDPREAILCQDVHSTHPVRLYALRHVSTAARSSVLHLSVQDNPITGQTRAFPFDREKDLVPFANRISTTTITVEAARSLFGRFVQSSTEPLRDDAPPTAKKQKKTMGNEYQAQTVAITWGLTVDQDDQFSKWSQKTHRWIKNLNAENADKLIKVGQNGTFLVGELVKGDSDEFEFTISGTKPGTWRRLVSEPLLAQLAWVCNGTVNYDALPQESGESPRPVDVDDSIEELGTFTVDSSHASLFSQSAFDSLTSGNDREAHRCGYGRSGR